MAIAATQQVAQRTIPQLLRIIAQRKWANAHAEELKFKANEINIKIELSGIISRSRGSMWGAYINSVKDDPFHGLIAKVEELSLKQEQVRTVLFEGEHAKDLIAPVLQLRAARAEDKRAVLRAQHVVSVAVAAAYLGVFAAVLQNFVSTYAKVIGARYAGGDWLSIDEVFMIEKNMNWLDGNATTNETHDAAEPDETAFDHLIYVDVEIASAYTDMASSDLPEFARRSSQPPHLYRLSELEKIRVAKVNSPQQ